MIVPKLREFYYSALLLTIACAAATVAQTAGEPADVRPAPARQGRGAVIRTLDLTPAQLGQLRSINQERRPLEQAARRRFQDAQKALNDAIYSDTATEQDFQARLAEFRSAQGDLATVRFTTEMAVRRLLTPEQLVRFRNIRKDFSDRATAPDPARPLRDRRNRPARPARRPPGPPR